MLINWRSRQLLLKIVYYGPAMSGKTTNLEQIHAKINPANRSDLVSLKTHEERTLYFDFMQFELGKICGLTPNIQLYTVPGQEYYKSSRRLVLRGADGVVFVADSNAMRVDDNIQSWNDMDEYLASSTPCASNLPMVIQYNKRDLQNALPTHVLRTNLGYSEIPEIEAVALKGLGVLDTLKMILNRVMIQVQATV